MRFISAPVFLFFVLLCSVANGEERSYGQIDLTGLARDSWSYNPPGLAYAMVCNVNGPDGFLSVRNGPGTSYKTNRKLSRLAVLEVDTGDRAGNWVRVVTAYRTHSKDGKPLEYKSLHVSGWVHDGQLCDFLD